MKIRQIVIVTLTFLIATMVCKTLPDLNSSTSSIRPLDRRQCLWNPDINDFDCNDHLPTMAQHIWALRNPDLGKVGPDTVVFFYTNLFEPGESSPTNERVAKVLRSCYAWLKGQNLISQFSQAVCSSSAYTLAGGEWLMRNYNWISSEEDEAKKAVAPFGSTQQAEFLFNLCRYQSLSLVAPPDVYFFTRRDEEPSENSWWTVAEFWPLTRDGGTVLRVWRIDPRPASEGGMPCDKVLMWERGRDPPILSAHKCPINTDDGSIPNLPADPFANPFGNPPQNEPPQGNPSTE